MKNLPLLLMTVGGSILLIVGLALLFSRPPKSAQIDQSQLLNGAALIKGPESASVTIVEFSDFQCPACRAAQSLVGSIIEKYPNQVRLVFRNFPLDSIHPYARRVAEAAVVMNTYDLFWEYNDKLFDQQSQWSEAESVAELDKILAKYAVDLGVEESSFSARLASEEIGQVVAEDAKLANQLGLNATPTFFVNGKQVSAQQLLQAVEEALQQEGG